MVKTNKRTPIGKVVSIIFSFEMLFALFLHAGVYKANPVINSVFPIDITLFFFIASVAIGFYIIAFKRGFKIEHKAGVSLLLFIIFLIYSLFSLIWTPGSAYATEKILHMFSLVAWSFVASIVIIAPSTERVKRFLLINVLFGGWLTYEAFQAYLQTSGVNFVTVNGSGYLGVGQLISVGAVIIFGFLLFYRNHIFIKLVSLLLFIFFMSILLILGGRGPLLAAFIGILVPVFYAVRLNQSFIKIKGYAVFIILIFLSSVLSLVYLWQTNQQLLTLSRLVAFFQGADPSSAGTRSSYYEDSIFYWMESPLLGNGIGSWPVLHYGSDIRDYPHNIFLEIIVELGLVGLILFLLLLGYFLRNVLSIKKVASNKMNILLVMIFANSFLNVLLSGDIPDNRMFFVFLGLLSYLHDERKLE
ncbi:O-antigen ligase [Salirhabdus euzebyi]|uniref:O-antigen ligase n=1 Tax=Salirhabdus euzebyi TaxID=394506 RepID=A0A841Q4F7_9BACI|nr:O-antigen ligase family protein [Salirhabdus euzebyi]MBB6453301.1 O-antigen ligase [Salirhabdus euzebyi]